MAKVIADGVHEIDTLLGGWERVTSGYLVDGPEPVLVETGSQSSVPALLAALNDLGIAAEDLAHVVVTHIHLDHAGGVGDVAQAFPQATVHVHEKGARHLVDPTRLVDSAAMVYGDLLDSLYGRLTPNEAAKHHLGLHDSLSGLLFVGDAVGVRLPDAGILRPATPPPDFDLDQALTSIAKFAARRPTGIALAHYGLVPEAEAVLDEASEILTRWAEVAEVAWQQGEDIAEALDTAFGGDLDGVDPVQKQKLETLNGIHSNAAGFRRWLDKRADSHGHHHHPHTHRLED
jgi:glyoxylase-like metal-dependent hydrolase (beta-lactamase superfamily II)